MQDTSNLTKRITPLIFLGLLVSLYLSHHHIEIKSNLQIGASICSFDEVFDCDSVAKSSYSEVFGVPVAFLGVFFYSSLLLLFLFTKNSESSVRKSINSLVFLLFGVSLLGNIYLGYKSYIELHKVCLFCSLLYVVNFALFFVTLYFKNERTELKTGVSYFLYKFLPSMKGVFFILGNIALLLLVQNFPKVYESYYLLPRYLSVYDKKVIGELVEQWKSGVPSIDENLAMKLPGAIIREPMSKSGPVSTIVEYADYECPFCQKISPILEKIYEDSSSNVRLVLLQFPLDKSCNRSIQGNFHQNSCRIAHAVLCAGMDYGISSIELHRRVVKDKIVSKEAIDNLLAEYKIDEMKCEKAEQAIKDQIDFALAANIHSTPSIFISGKSVKFNSFPQAESLLKAITELK